MRPITTDPAFVGPRGNSSNDSLASSSQTPQMTYFLADEKTLEESQPSPTFRPTFGNKSTTYGVESLENTLSSLNQDQDESDSSSSYKARDNWKNRLMRQPSKVSLDRMSSRSCSPKSSAAISRDTSPVHEHPRCMSQNLMSQPLTPVFADSMASSIISDLNSRRGSVSGSFTDEVASQAIASDDEDMETPMPDIADSGSVPQLVMPSIKMPSRRPFTEKGKNMGRFKVLIAGDSGVGKTSLIKAIVQICEDIVHVDPLNTASVTIPESQKRKKSKNNESLATTSVTEVYASTKPYPSWWSESDDTKVLRRRKSMGGTVLERNICFVDTPGYSSGTSCMECITPVVNYIESQFDRPLSMAATESETINLLSGGGGTMVDVVFYVVKNRIKPVDIEYLRRLAPLTNIIPIIAQSDAISGEQISILKEHILSELRAAGIHPFLFDVLPDDALKSARPCGPFAVSTALSNDDDTMDASLLMSPDYVQPLVPTELSSLVEQIFNGETIAWLRHLAAKKFIHWKNEGSSSQETLSPYSVLSLQPSYSIVPRASSTLTTTAGASTSYALARIADHTQREERLAQIRLSNWAADLQRSIQNERARFDNVAREERIQWLTQRLDECMQERVLLTMSDMPSSDAGAVVSQGTYSRRRNKHKHRALDRTDPLGLLQLHEELKHKSWAALQIVGSVGIIGGLAYFLARNWGREDDLLVWGLDMSRFGFDF